MMSREPNYSASSSPHESQKDVEKRVGPLYYKDAAYPVHGRLCLCRAGRSTQLNSDQILCSRNPSSSSSPCDSICAVVVVVASQTSLFASANKIIWPAN